MRRMNIFSLTVGLFAASTAFAQAPKPAGLAARESALDQAMDRKDIRENARSARRAKPEDIDINCNQPNTHNGSINSVLARLDPARTWILDVSGTCKENVVVQSFENLTLIAKPGASISDNSGGNLDVIDVFDTHEFSMQGFSVNGGSSGVGCGDYSQCRFSGNTVQGSTGDGIFIARSRASLQGDTLQNNAGRGLAVINGGVAATFGVTFQGNAEGADANVGSTLIASNVISQNNGGAGIRIANHSTLRLIDSTLSGNSDVGVRVVGSSEANFVTNITGNVITGNAGPGVLLGDLSFASFVGADHITGNNPGGFDVFCAPQFSATRGALTGIGGGLTNCSEP
jgi:parallel beta-helix repeat protein